MSQENDDERKERPRAGEIRNETGLCGAVQYGARDEMTPVSSLRTVQVIIKWQLAGSLTNNSNHSEMAPKGRPCQPRKAWPPSYCSWFRFSPV